MDDKLRILQCIIENRICAPSASALAKLLGYKGKMTLYRIVKGEVSQKLVEEVWGRLQEEYCLEDTDFYDIEQICLESKCFHSLILAEMDTQQSHWVEEVITSLVEDSCQSYSEAFRKTTVPKLKEMKQEKPEIFWGMVVLFYIRAKNINPYQKDFARTQCNLARQLDELLFSLHPECSEGHQASLAFQSMAQQLQFPPSIWHLLTDNIPVFRFYTETAFSKTAVKSLMLFNWPLVSYWIVPGIAYQEGADVWLWLASNYDTVSNGVYIVLHLKAGGDIETFKTVGAYIFLFWRNENEDFSMMQSNRIVNRQNHFCHYLYDYDEANRLMHFDDIPEWGNLHELPETLYRIDLSAPKNKEERVWSRILNKFDEDGTEREVVIKAVDALRGVTDLSDKYEIVDVVVSRSSLCLILKDTEADTESTYRLPITAYPFLSKITPAHDIGITRYEDDGEIYVEWPFLGYAIKLSEFSCHSKQ